MSNRVSVAGAETFLVCYSNKYDEAQEGKSLCMQTSVVGVNVMEVVGGTASWPSFVNKTQLAIRFPVDTDPKQPSGLLDPPVTFT